jgi:hypothetical protein
MLRPTRENESGSSGSTATSWGCGGLLVSRLLPDGSVIGGRRGMPEGGQKGRGVIRMKENAAQGINAGGTKRMRGGKGMDLTPRWLAPRHAPALSSYDQI